MIENLNKKILETLGVSLIDTLYRALALPFEIIISPADASRLASWMMHTTATDLSSSILVMEMLMPHIMAVTTP